MKSPIKSFGIATLNGIVSVISDPRITNGHKKTIDDKIFISPKNYEDLDFNNHSCTVNNIIMALHELKETNEWS